MVHLTKKSPCHGESQEVQQGSPSSLHSPPKRTPDVGNIRLRLEYPQHVFALAFSRLSESFPAYKLWESTGQDWRRRTAGLVPAAWAEQVDTFLSRLEVQ